MTTLRSFVAAAALFFLAPTTLASTSDGIVTFKGGATMDASAEDVVAAMRDNTTAARWMPMVGERYTVKELAGTRRVEYTYMKMPWPATDRYFVSTSEVTPLGGGEWLIVVESVEPKDFEGGWTRKDKILATFHHSEFRVKHIDEHRSELSFEMRSSAGGALPTWLVKMGQKNWPRDFVTKLREELKTRRSGR